MCYSALVIQHQKKLARAYGATFDEEAYEGLFYLRLQQPGIKIPKAMDDAALEEGGRLAELVSQWRDRQATELQQEIFAQTKRVADAERKLQAKVTKAAQNDVRIGTDKVSKAKVKLADLTRTTLKDRDTQIFPLSYSAVIVAEGGKRYIRPMRYLCRPEGMPAASDYTQERKLSGKYNARRDNLTRFWRPQFGRQHGLMVATRFYENVEAPDGRNRVLEFVPQDGSEMLIACLWSHWTDPRGQEPDLLSFAAITDDPEPEVAAAGHDRTIINIKPEHVDAWLSPDGRSDAELLAIFDDKRHPYYEHREAA
jgi:putative SOS response-associated peptidase YedK